MFEFGLWLPRITLTYFTIVYWSLVRLIKTDVKKICGGEFVVIKLLWSKKFDNATFKAMILFLIFLFGCSINILTDSNVYKVH